MEDHSESTISKPGRPSRDAISRARSTLKPSTPPSGVIIAWGAKPTSAATIIGPSPSTSGDPPQPERIRSAAGKAPTRRPRDIPFMVPGG